MDDIIEPTIDYDFSKLYLGPPSTLAGGSYFTRLMYNNNKHLFVQTPKCTSKQGFIKSGKKIYTDLMFDNNDTVFINWIENLETTCQELLHSKSASWFENKLEKDDIEAAFTSPLKIYKSGKFYLLRVNVKPNIKIYNESDEIVKTEDITSETNIISILEIQGIKFSSRNFQIEMELKQSLLVSPDPFLDECFIKKPIKKQNKEDSISNTEKNISNKEKEIKEKEFKAEEKEIKNLDNFIKETIEELNNANINLNINTVEPTFSSKDVVSNEAKTLEINNTLDDNILLDIEELTKKEEVLEDPNILKEIDLTKDLENNLETITLKKPNQVYYEIYQKAREKAKEAKKAALLAYLELKNIKKTYMLEDIDESDSEFEMEDENEEIDLEDL